MSDAFEALGLYTEASEAEVKARWRELAAIHHPDRGGDAQEFDRLRKAYTEALVASREPLTCLACGGTRKRLICVGFSSLSVDCQECGGTGVIQRSCDG